ncbi:hypothetical protein OZX57_02250 [Bifidobacterium sp. ESL0682]|uniref:hypothetical protein n=1 Tax=Bifidobacterium sp. ESL0682 TaxID=2983212 RepID=UPI0023F95968|nr:hypothetical protein [Bifidobacterium sp. ESL0682]WEV42317.1 hypothetical protein OZX57_02250 [Bifidobacterium sp. ESL0682]
MDNPQKDEAREDAETSKDSAEEAKPKKKHGRKFYTLVAAIAALVVVGGYSGVAYASDSQYNGSVNDSEQASESFINEYNKAQKLVKDVKPGQVADANTITNLQSELKASKSKTEETPSISPNGMLVWETTKAKGIQKDYTEKVNTETKKLSDLEGKVTGSQLDKAKSDLKADITNAQNLYNSTEGQVADASTRDALKKGIDSANKLFSELKNKGTKEAQQVIKDLHIKTTTPSDWVKKFTDAKSKLDAAQKAVTDSQAAKQQSDAAAQQAADQSAQDAQSQQQAAQSQGGSSQGSTSGYSASSRNGGSSRGGGNRYSAPSRGNGSSAPHYSAPAPSHSQAPSAPHYSAPNVPSHSSPAPSAPSNNGGASGVFGPSTPGDLNQHDWVPINVG